MYDSEVTFHGMNSSPKFIKNYLLVQKLLGGDTDGEKQHVNLISLTFFFKESRVEII
jgi:hypothetical protein